MQRAAPAVLSWLRQPSIVRAHRVRLGDLFASWAAHAARPARFLGRAGPSCRRAANWTHDGITGLGSAADMITDLLVMHEFWSEGRDGCFVASLVVLLLAQLSFACVFVKEFGRQLSSKKQALALAAILPIAQLVPIMLYAASQSEAWPWVDRVIEAVGLCNPETATQLDATPRVASWEAMQKKLRAHHGFLVEALVEAVPQCAIQTVAA